MLRFWWLGRGVRVANLVVDRYLPKLLYTLHLFCDYSQV